MIQITTGFEVVILKGIDKYRVLVEYTKNNCLYSKRKTAIMYKCDLRELNIFDFIGSDKE